MNTLDLETLTKFTEQAQKLQTIARELQPFLEMMKELDGRTIIPTDRLIRASEATEVRYETGKQNNQNLVLCADYSGG